MALEHLTASNFDDNTGAGVALVDFSAPWCGPCRALQPVMEQLAADYEGKVLVGKVNTDEEPELAEKFQIRSIPAVFFMKDGEVVSSAMGARPKQFYAEQLDQLLGG